MGWSNVTSVRSVVAVSPTSAPASFTRTVAPSRGLHEVRDCRVERERTEVLRDFLASPCGARARGRVGFAGRACGSAPVERNRSTAPRTRHRKRSGPLIPSSLHSASFSGGPRKSTNARTASAPFSAISGSSETALPARLRHLLDAARRGQRRVIMPWLKRAENGSSNVTRPRSFRIRAKNRAYRRCRIACSMPPHVWSTRAHSFTTAGSNGALPFFGSMYRR